MKKKKKTKQTIVVMGAALLTAGVAVAHAQTKQADHISAFVSAMKRVTACTSKQPKCVADNTKTLVYAYIDADFGDTDFKTAIAAANVMYAAKDLGLAAEKNTTDAELKRLLEAQAKFIQDDLMDHAHFPDH